MNKEKIKANILNIFAELINKYGVNEGEDIIATLKSCIIAKNIIASFKVSANEQKKTLKRVIQKYLNWRGKKGNKNAV